MRQTFLPLGLLAAIVFAFILPAGGICISEKNGASLLIIIIFLVSGYQTGTKGITLDKGLLRILLTAATVSLILSPFLGLALGRISGLSQSLLTGLVIICAVPPTLSSGIVITEVSRGNAVLALLLTVSLNLLGIFTLPFMLDFCLSMDDPVEIKQIALLIKMLLLVLLPFSCGRIIRSATGKNRVSPHWSYVNSSCIILVVYTSLAVSGHAFSGTDISEYALILFSVALIHCLLLGINAVAAKILRLNFADRNALILVVSQKTLPISLAVLAGLDGNTGNAVVVCLMLHFFQLFVDSMLASTLRKVHKTDHNTATVL